MRFLELARMTTPTTGTGTATLGSAVTGAISFATAGAANGDVISYGIQDGAASEIGWGVYSTTGPTLTRNLINSTTGALLSLTGNAEIFATIRPADLIVASAGLGVGGPPMVNGTLNVTASSSNLVIAVKTLAGGDPSPSDPVDFTFPNSTGGYTIVRVQAALNFTVLSGATLGVNAATPFRVWIVAFNDAGTIRLGAICCSSPGVPGQLIYPLGDGIESATLMATTSDNPGVIYANAAVSAKPMRILGYNEWNSSGLAVAGTWTITNSLATMLFGPGVAAPGDTVQVQQVSTSTPTNASATVAVTTTGLSKSFTRKSLCNVVRVEAYGSMAVNSAGMVTAARLYKAGSTIINASTVYCSDDTLGGGQFQDIGAALIGMDFPSAGQGNPVTYDVRIDNSSTVGTGSWGRNSNLSTMVMTELQV